MDCEICGSQIYGKGRSIIIDGARLTVCFKCAQFTPSNPQNIGQQPVRVRKAPLKTRQQPAKRQVRSIIREDLELVENCDLLVRKAREKKGLTHDELSREIAEKASVLQKLETGKLVPDQTLIKKLEYALKIRLLQPASRIQVDEEFKKKPSEVTLGDILSLQSKKRDRMGE